MVINPKPIEMEGIKPIQGVKVIVGLALCAILFVAAMMFIMPLYHVWSSEQAGRAELAQATYNRQIAVQEAEAKKEAASKLADAEVMRADGVARANKIIGESLNGNEAYLRYLWITEVAGKDIDKTVVYIPTETNIPILEAGRTGSTLQKKWGFVSSFVYFCFFIFLYLR